MVRSVKTGYPPRELAYVDTQDIDRRRTAYVAVDGAAACDRRVPDGAR